MPMSEEERLHYQAKCVPETCVLCALEAKNPVTKPLVNTGMLVRINGADYPVWSFDGKRLFAGKEMNAEHPTGGHARLYSHIGLEELQATIEITEAMERTRKETQ